ncbi:nuclear transport factor 2 family protein [Pseudomonas sp. SBB6]|uniref:nuclear transport factor 2 family protein n=1 Tax=Pseudomonas sp. SBB6 TaxID=2962032 RepID=UPI0020B6E358|nr:nuclear transport factor 2 family protein [Pseudomonas sp. SBB6]MCP3750482.1 nuclear transport factor 2 family protein [Pseudomonas sp. SBB6]
MKIASRLQLMRKEWYHAFYALDIQQLDYLEAEWFFSTNGSKLMYKKNQLQKLGLLKRQNPSAFSALHREEREVVTRELGNLATVSGVAIVKGAEGTKCVSFIENWIKINDAWKLQFLTFEEDQFTLDAH